MSKKNNTTGGKGYKKPNKASKGKEKARKPNRYNAIRSATSQYCRDKYGKPCPNTKLNSIYRELKKKYDKVPLEKVLKRIDGYIRTIDSVAPELATSVNWFEIEDLLSNELVDYFKPNDKISFDLSIIGEEPIQIKYKDFSKKYRDDIYNKLTQVDGLRESPIAQFLLDKAKTDTKVRSFNFSLERDEELDEADTIKPKVIEQKGVASRSSEDLKRIENIQERGQQELDRLRWEFENKLITPAEYSKEAKNIRSKFFNKGGKI